MGHALNAAGHASAPAQRRAQRLALREWESEGGSLAAAPLPQPSPGIEVTVAAQYRVGSYRYTDLACAEAELRRQQGLRHG